MALKTHSQPRTQTFFQRPAAAAYAERSQVDSCVVINVFPSKMIELTMQNLTMRCF